MSNQKEKLFTDFPAVTTEEWMEVVTRDLRGADFERRLVWRTNEGFNVNPFYRAEDIEGFLTTDILPGEFPYVRSTRKDNVWYVRQEMSVSDYSEANRKAKSLLDKGVTSFGFYLPKNNLSLENLKVLLDGIAPDKVELNFNTCISSIKKLAEIVVEYITSLNLNVLECHGSIEYDPFRLILKKGIDPTSWIDQAVEIVNITAPLPRYKSISVTGNVMNDAGAYSYQELGFSLAYGNQVLSALIEKGVAPSLAAKKIKFALGVGSNYFMEIAKFRAGRWLWAEIVNAYRPPCVVPTCDNKAEDGTCRCAAKMNIHAITSRFNQSLYDPYVNMLRSQTEAMSAAIGSVDSLTVRPFDEVFETPTDFAERIALNQQLLLKEESHFDKVTDPSSGSYYIEKLTSSLAEQAWNLFVDTDEKGFYAALKEGIVQDAIQASADARFDAAAKRREILLGTNQYPNFTEKMADKIDNPVKLSCGCGDGETPLKPLIITRLAEQFNELRLATERSAKTPKVFMLTIGNLAMRLARSQFSSNFFACAGYEVIDNNGFPTVEEGVEAARKVGADVIVLCSSDDEYVEYAPKAYDLVKEGKEQFVIAGAPACMDDLKAHGIEHFINVRSNVYEVLKEFNNKLLG